MDQDATWYGGRPRPRRLCVRWGPHSPSPKRGRAPQIFRPCLLWPNGWMDQDGTWHRCRPQLRRLCVTWGPSLHPQKGCGAPPQYSAHFYCGQMAGCIKVPLGMLVGLIPRGISVRWGSSPAPQKVGGVPRNFWRMFIVAKWPIKMALGMEVGLSPGDCAR